MNKNLLAGLAAASLLVGGGGATALAAAGAPAAASAAAVVPGAFRAHNCGPLESLVTKGTITQKQAVAIHDAVVSYVQGHWRNMLDTVLGQLVKDHAITQAQASAVDTEITQWAQKYQGNGSGHQGPSGYQSPCPHMSDMGMKGGPGNQ